MIFLLQNLWQSLTCKKEELDVYFFVKIIVMEFYRLCEMCDGCGMCGTLVLCCYVVDLIVVMLESMAIIRKNTL